MLRFKMKKTLQRVTLVHANVSNHFKLDCHIGDRQPSKITPFVRAVLREMLAR